MTCLSFVREIDGDEGQVMFRRHAAPECCIVMKRMQKRIWMDLHFDHLRRSILLAAIGGIVHERGAYDTCHTFLKVLDVWYMSIEDS